MNYLIDCGTHLGEGLSKHIEKYNVTDDWNIFSFEANPHTFNLLQNTIKEKNIPYKYRWLLWKKFIHQNKAVWINDDIINFYPSNVCQTNELKNSTSYKEFLSYHDSLLKSGDLITDHQRQIDPIDGSSTLFADHFKEYLSKNGNILQKNITWNNPCKVQAFNFSNWLKNTIVPNSFVVCKIDIEGAEFEVLEQCIKDNTIELINILNIEFHHFDNKNLISKHNQILDKLKSYSIEVNGW
jgi:FkbM family methyltransferase